MKTIRWGIIGCGDVCEVKSGPGFYKSDHSSLLAIMRRDGEKAADFARRHGVPLYYTNADDLIGNPDIDVVYIATPPKNHVEYVIKALHSGKPVYVEKPMGLNYDECLLMNRVARATSQKLWVAYYRRSLPYFLKVKELLDQHVIGDIQVVNTVFMRPPLPADSDHAIHSWRTDKATAGGGYFFDMACHTIDILMFLLGNIDVAKGVVSNVGHFYEVEDVVSASLLFESGIVGSSVWNYVSSADSSTDLIEITGSKGTIGFSTFECSDIVLRSAGSEKHFYFEKPVHIQQCMIQDIVNELLGCGECASTGETGAQTNRVMDQIVK